jgi:hypothetical protein
MRLLNDKLIYPFEIKSSQAFIYVNVQLEKKVSHIPPVSIIRVDVVIDRTSLIYVSGIDLTGRYVLYINEV